MYESPITLMVQDIAGQIAQQTEQTVLEVVRKCGVYVDKEELIKALSYDREQYQKGYHDGLDANKWIPVSEGLPEDRLYVLATYKYEYGLIDQGITWYDKTEDRWDTSREVIAWMPLPEPYMAESEDKE